MPPLVVIHQKMRIQKPTFLLVMMKLAEYIKENKQSKLFFQYQFLVSNSYFSNSCNFQNINLDSSLNLWPTSSKILF